MPAHWYIRLLHSSSTHFNFPWKILMSNAPKSEWISGVGSIFSHSGCTKCVEFRFSWSGIYRPFGVTIRFTKCILLMKRTWELCGKCKISKKHLQEAERWRQHSQLLLVDPTLLVAATQTNSQRRRPFYLIATNCIQSSSITANEMENFRERSKYHERIVTFISAFLIDDH